MGTGSCPRNEVGQQNPVGHLQNLNMATMELTSYNRRMVDHCLRELWAQVTLTIMHASHAIM
jgi:hypothetical protein